MATGLVLEFQGVGEKEYDRVMEKLRLDQNPAEGGIFHAAGPIPNGWRVFDVWESRGAFEQFLRNRLTPIFKEVGIPNPTRIDYFPIHNAYVGQPSVLNTLTATTATTRR